MPYKSASDCAMETDFNLKAGCLVDGDFREICYMSEYQQDVFRGRKKC